MDCRLRRNPLRIFECFLEVSENRNDSTGREVVLTYPRNYDDQEILHSVPPFCFPCKTERNMEQVQHFTFTLTDGEGKYRFGFCRFPPSADVCLCIISYLPWFDNFYKILNFIGDYYWKGQVQLALDFIKTIYETPAPAPSVRNITFATTDESTPKLTLEIPDPYALPSIPKHRNLTDFVCALQPGNMLHLFACLLHERRIIITSSKLKLLTACVYSAAGLLYPMYWQHIFIPVLPPHLIDYCCAPMPFLIGIHSSLMEDVRKKALSEVVILNVDNNEMELPEKDLNSLPQELVQYLKSALKKSDAIVDDTIPRAFLDIFVYLLGSYKKAVEIDGENHIYEFNRELFLHGLHQNVKQFMDKVTQLQQFQQFIAERLEIYNNDSKTDNDDFFDTYVANSPKINLTVAMIKASSHSVFKKVLSTNIIKKISKTSSGMDKDQTSKKFNYHGTRPTIELLGVDVDPVPEYKTNTMNPEPSKEIVKPSVSVDKLIDFGDDNTGQPNATGDGDVNNELKDYVMIDSPPPLQKDHKICNRSVPNFMELDFESKTTDEQKFVDVDIAEMTSKACHTRRSRDNNQRINVKIHEPGSIETSDVLHPRPLHTPPPVPPKRQHSTAATNSTSVRPRPTAKQQQFISLDDTGTSTRIWENLDSGIKERRQVISFPSASDTRNLPQFPSVLPPGVNANPAAICNRKTVHFSTSPILQPTSINTDTKPASSISEFDPFKS